MADILSKNDGHSKFSLVPTFPAPLQLGEGLWLILPRGL